MRRGIAADSKEPQMLDQNAADHYDLDTDDPDANEISEDTARLYAKPPNPGACPTCRTTLACTPTGHTCPSCGFHDPAVCARHTPPPDLIEAELEYRRLIALSKRNTAAGGCGYIRGRGPAGRAIAAHPWLQQYPAGPQRRAARKILRTAADRAAALDEEISRELAKPGARPY